MIFLKAVFFVFLILTQNVFCKAACKEEEIQKTSIWDSLNGIVSVATDSDNLKFGLKTAAMAGAAIVGAPVLLSAAGFGASGIAAGSLAATYQSTILGGTVLSGSAFSALQSLGAAGLGATGKAAIVSLSAAVLKTYDAMAGNSEKKECSEEESC